MKYNNTELEQYSTPKDVTHQFLRAAHNDSFEPFAADILFSSSHRLSTWAFGVGGETKVIRMGDEYNFPWHCNKSKPPKVLRFFDKESCLMRKYSYNQEN